MEVSVVRQRLLAAMAQAKSHAQERRTQLAEAERAFAALVANTAVPLARQLAGALKAEKLPFTVSTPEGGLRITSDHGRDDFVELALDTTVDPPCVVVRSRRARGSRTLDEERAVKAGVPIDEIGDVDVLEAFLSALAPWMER